MSTSSVASKPSRVVAVASFTFGLLACFTFTLLISPIAAVIAVVLGHAALAGGRSRPRRGRGWAIAGLALGYIFVAGFLLALSIDPARLGF